MYLSTAKTASRVPHLPTLCGKFITIAAKQMPTKVHPHRHLVDYVPYRIEDAEGNRIKNPAFTNDCRRILDLKDSSEKGHAKAVAYFSEATSCYVENELPFERLKIHVVVVPSSTKGKWSPGMLAIADHLIAEHRNLVDSRRALERTQTIAKLANGGSRNISVHMQSINITDRNASRLQNGAVLLMDDVATTGNSLRACVTILQQCDVAHIFPFTIGQTHE